MYAERGFFRACPPFASSVESASFFPAFFFEDFFSSYFCDLSAGTAFMEAFAAPLEALEAFFPLCWSSGWRSPSFFNFSFVLCVSLASVFYLKVTENCNASVICACVIDMAASILYL